MDTFRNDDEEDEDCFFDANEEVSSSSDGFGLELWTKNLDSVSDRRRKFFKSMGFSFKKDNDSVSDDEIEQEQSQSSVLDSVNGDRVKEEEEEELLLSRNESTSSSLFDRSSVSSSDSSSSSSSIPDGLSESSSSKSSNFEDFRDSSKGSKRSWFKKKLGVLTHVLDSIDCSKSRIARVHTYKKQFKELSSLSIDQEFSAHDGSILSMKFSPDGKYIASAGEDCIIRVWSIIEEVRTEVSEVLEPGVYFGMNQDSQIEPLKMNNEKKTEKTTTFLRKSPDATCVVLPSTIFSISEKPLHEFVGHEGEILDLSWSKKGYYLLSSSVDETVRLWRVGSDQCLSTFSHNNFVTCVAFNPMDENYFISGSIDGKVRIWDISRSRVVCYTDIRDIVTAVCYRPDSKGVVIGSMTGNIRFYDNQLQMDREMKVGSKRITGLEFLPNHLNKVMVTSADSQIRIICGDDVICKLKASSLRANSASFTLDGKHIVSTTEDSSIHVWNYSQLSNKKEKSKRIRSYEGFLSQNASVAIPWLREGSRNGLSDCIMELDKKIVPKVDCFSPMKGSSTTWPEEKLEEEGCNKGRKLKLLRSAWRQPHLWGLVIVTATWDGRIRVFQNYGLPIRV